MRYVFDVWKLIWIGVYVVWIIAAVTCEFILERLKRR